MAESPPRRIPLFAVFRDAFLLPVRHGGELLRAAGLPLLALIAVTMLWDFVPATSNWLLSWIPYLIYVAAFSWLASTIHRLVLLDEASEPAHAAWREVSALLAQSDRLDADAMRWQMRAHSALGKADEAARIRERLRSAGYHHPDLVEGSDRTGGR